MFSVFFSRRGCLTFGRYIDPLLNAQAYGLLKLFVSRAFN